MCNVFSELPWQPEVFFSLGATELSGEAAKASREAARKRPLAQAVKSFERADPITLPVISPESRFDPGNLIGRLEKRFLKGLLLAKCAMILAKLVLPTREQKNKNGRSGRFALRDSERSEINS